MNYGNAIGTQESAAMMEKSDIMDVRSRTTVGENIDRQIASLKAEIERLEGLRGQLRGGASLLDIRIEDLRRAMNY